MVLKGVPRLTREDWLTTAKSALVASGIDDVKVDRLAKRMKVTRGSFYYHFKDRQDLVDALLRDWEVRNQVEIAQVRDRWLEREPDLSEVVVIWLGEDSGTLAFDLAIRHWARRAGAVASVVHRVDEAWIGLLIELFRVAGYSEAESLVRARITYFHQIGYYALDVRERMDERLKLVPLYYSILTGKPPSPTLESVIKSLKRRRPSGTKRSSKA